MARVVAMVGLLAVASPPLYAAGGQQPSFEGWLAALRKEALVAGISEATVNRALDDLQPIRRVMELDRDQPELKLTLEQYLQRVVPERRVRQGRRKLAENRALLADVSARYGVQPRFLVAFWGIETDFGRITGGYSVVAALATLAYDGRRGAYFRKELLDALHILDEGHIDVDGMIGSWAGAMGQAQFMPSTFRRYATDYDGDTKIDLWNNRGDVFASAANYLANSGWKGDQTWGRTVRLPADFDRGLISDNIQKPLSEWQALGVRRADGRDLPTRDLMASLVQPDGPSGRAYVTYNNYRAILNWNRSDNFAIAVGTLADRIAGR